MSLFVSRYVSTMAMFILGLRAPGIVQQHYDALHGNNPYNATRLPMGALSVRISTVNDLCESKKACISGVR